ncbi:MAG: hypothetical protein A3D31_03595 [Candidatus Fluviicola riflensis]|nr:MAG: hypothetical protein CHH17_11435 [Candidatus Fluviicola riflensis]OGS79062.1 MAG: hypothetical protein A3D31_03595 [Candidatus Fluviicola riflensis]OGS86085.1 MAG: hypothetical protein A3E30_11085 [Fluviicola sp. RIFCSPHIGHO2_12_FULL_43_24]OGS86494.1 MAG: hypothetical protein A2724_03055 [Fluviicola sp. RIFCSPHIGHO2_01_FULL_43_53]
MEIPSSKLIDFGNLAVGIGTFTLALVLGIISILSTRKSRKIHIADKRQEWVSTFRKQISQVLSLQQHYTLIISDCTVEELDLLLKELNLAQNEIRFMFDSNDTRRDKLEELFAEISNDFKNKQTENFAKKQYQIINLTDSIISQQRKKIVDLDNSEPII